MGADGKSCELKVSKALDREEQAKYELGVLVEYVDSSLKRKKRGKG